VSVFALLHVCVRVCVCVCVHLYVCMFVFVFVFFFMCEIFIYLRRFHGRIVTITYMAECLLLFGGRRH
jgi:hypothetical protein